MLQFFNLQEIVRMINTVIQFISVSDQCLPNFYVKSLCRTKADISKVQPMSIGLDIYDDMKETAMKYVLILPLLLISVYGYSQNHASCYIENYMTQDVSDFQMETNKLEYRSGHNDVINVRTVFHILYGSQAENIENDSIHTIVDNVNNIFCGIVDTLSIHERFRHLINDTGIRICLATEDEDGNPTEGITRTEVDMAFDINDPLESLKSDDLGGKTPWDTTKYFNIWLMPTTSTLFTSNYGIPLTGYLPLDTFVDPISIPGVALDIAVFTGGNLGAASTGQGILAHEIGHGLGLLHTFGTGASGVDICSIDDFAEDTPVCRVSFFCDGVEDNTCIEMEDDEIDMSSNSMNVGCMIFFTPDQTSFMRENLMKTPELHSTDCDDLSSTNSIYSKTERLIFPNPNRGEFEVLLDHQASKIKLYDITGRQVPIITSISETGIKIELVDKSVDGLYLLSIDGISYKVILGSI